MKFSFAEGGRVKLEGHPGHYIREWRKKRGLTVNGLAAKSDVSASMISKLERGLAQYTQGMLKRLSEALEVEPEFLVAIDPDSDTQIWEYALRKRFGKAYWTISDGDRDTLLTMWRKQADVMFELGHVAHCYPADFGDLEPALTEEH